MRVSSWVRRSVVFSSAVLLLAGTAQAGAGWAQHANQTAASLGTRVAASGPTWNFETLDGTGSGKPGSTTDQVGSFNAVLNYANQIHQWYFDGGPTGTAGTLRHAWFDGLAWHYENLDGVGTGTLNGRVPDRLGLRVSADIYQSVPHVMYYDLSVHSLRHAWWTGSAWQFETLDGFGSQYAGANVVDDMGLGNALTNVASGIELHVFYRDLTAKTLRHAFWAGGTWNFETLDGAGTNGRTTDDVGQFPKVVPWAGQPHVFYYDLTSLSLRHAWWSGTAWFFETLDGTGSPYLGRGRATTDDVGGSKMAAKQYNNQLHVYYYNRTRHTLRHAWFDPSANAWFFEVLDGSGVNSPGATTDRVGEDASALDFNGQAQVFYYDQSGSLRHAWFNGFGWTRETLDGTGSNFGGSSHDALGQSSSAVVYGTQLHAFYFDTTANSLRHSWYG